MTQNDQDQFKVRDKFLFRNILIYIPDGPCWLCIIKECQHKAIAGNFGFVKTLELIFWSLWWPQPRKLVKEFMKTCDTCARAKSAHHRPYGLLQPLPNPTCLWASISTDFITNLPETDGFNSILVVVDRFTKMAHFIPCAKAISGVETTDLLLTNIVCLLGLSDEIMSDREPNSYQPFGNIFSKPLELSRSSWRHFIPRRTGKQSE